MVYRLYRVRDVIRIPPDKFNKPLEEAAFEEIRKTYEGAITKNMGVIVTVIDVEVEPYGRIMMGDGATYHNAEFTLLAFNPFVGEVVEGEVNTVLSHGFFVDLGLLDGYIHVSQISEEKIEYDPARPALVLKQSRKLIEKGDVVRARIYNVSQLKGKGLRIQMTIRQPGMGNIEWIKREAGSEESEQGV